jgi:mono/diheme cytochrome c family protein
MAALVADLSEVHVSEERVAFSLDPVPLGTWAQSCDAFAEARGARRANAFTEARDTNNRWIADGPFSSRGVPADAFIHEVSRGQAVVEAVCQNCHGVNFDSRSPLAATIAELSGGETRVADLRNGLFGPVDAPGAYADAVFTFSEGNDGAAARDWAARYLLFMGSGGTLAKIPEVALNMVATSPFYEGTMRNANDLGSANMLATVPCDKLLRTRLAVEQRAGGGFVLLPDTKTSDFVLDTGHFQLWESICGYQQQPIVRIMGVNEGFKLFSTGLLYYSRDRNGNATYPEGAWVGDQLGRVVPGIDASNTTPWCVLDNTEVSNWLETASIDASEVPFCPPELFASAFEEAQTSTSDPAAYHLHRMTIQGEPGILEDPERKEQWVRKGRFNAGLAAFIYFEQLAKGAVTPVPRFNSPECTR